MTTHEATFYLSTHAGDGPLVGYKVQILKPGEKKWTSMALAWDTEKQAREQAADLGGSLRRIVKVTVEPILANVPHDPRGPNP